jgi:alpha-beta hydrolase superfamily lysophospholipase
MPFEKVSFTNREGQNLAARLEIPAGESKAYALFAHCFTCTKNIKVAAIITQSLAQLGIAVMRFDFSGLGNSEGDFANTNFSSNVEDVVSAADFLNREFATPRLLIGHSLGGAAVLHAAAQISSATAVVTIGAPAEPGHVRKLIGASASDIERTGEAQVSVGGQTYPIRKQFLDDLAATRIRDSIAKLGRALLVMHAPFDEIVGIDNAAAIFTAAKHPKSFISLAQANHLLGRERDAKYAARVIAAWLEMYM